MVVSWCKPSTSALIKVNRLGNGKSSVRTMQLKEVQKIKDKEMEKKIRKESIEYLKSQDWPTVPKLHLANPLPQCMLCPAFFFSSVKNPNSLWYSSKHPRGLLATSPSSLQGNIPVTEISCLIASVQASTLGFNQNTICSESWENRVIAPEGCNKAVTPLRLTELKARSTKLAHPLHRFQILFAYLC